ncbi:hypothetical protein BJ684DRAFT_20153 [Piptocephalis cylindrospora]|uniref:Uncharacterized protein n=1 Tax=Piptocephalis cylindrospora TaxID=1907219 RepID=A0A4P9Y382_9FUNG|nr:hypothetical protein BJ684DRAFT_20153 [Piptocephalis cylindrospora]|eukprot:RKP13347.1 hypothetical protein BJ684DRAFT_20153 [Piptocephalis cylindrospora]
MDTVEDEQCQGLRMEIGELFFHGVLKEPSSSFVEYADRYCWRPVFHEVIDALRVRLRANSASEQQRKNQGGRQDARIYRLFLHEAAGYWSELARRLILQCTREPPMVTGTGLGDSILSPDRLSCWTNGDPYKTTDRLNGETIDLLSPSTRFILSYCYTALGDIARYRELVTRKKVKKWDGTLKRYLQALEVDPDQGRALHQMALTHQQTLDSFTTYYFYYMCQASKKPHRYGWRNFLHLLRSTPAPDTEGQDIVSMEEKVKMTWLRLHRHWYLEGTLGPKTWRDDLLGDIREALKDRYIRRDTLMRMVGMHLCALTSPKNPVESDEKRQAQSMNDLRALIIPSFTLPLLECLIDSFLQLLGEEKAEGKGGKDPNASLPGLLTYTPSLDDIKGWIGRLRKLVKELDRKHRAWRKDLESRVGGGSGGRMFAESPENIVILPEEKEARWISGLAKGFNGALKTRGLLDVMSCTVEQEMVIRLYRAKAQALELLRRLTSSSAVATPTFVDPAEEEEGGEVGGGESS